MSGDDNEVWTEMVPFPNYEVSSCGRVRSVDRVVARKRGGAYRLRGRVLAPYIDRSGNHFVKPSIRGKRTQVAVHRAVLLAFVGPPEPGEVCRHLNGNPRDNRVENLAWGTRRKTRETW